MEDNRNGAGGVARPYDAVDGAAFLRWVWPEGAPFYMCAVHNGRGMQHIPVADPDTAFRILQSYSEQGFETYYAFAGFDTPERKKRNVASLRVFVWDIDVGKDGAAPDKVTAAKELGQLVRTGRLPRPSAVVDSGGGLHVYWRMRRPLRRDEWQTVARQLKTLLKQRAPRLSVDLARVTDEAGLLRVPGTMNQKRGAQVALVKVLDDWDFDEFRRVVEENASRSSLADDLSVGKAGGEAPSFEALVEACPQFRNAYENQEKEGYDGWYRTVQLCSFLKDGRRAAHKVSERYPDYEVGETDAKFDSALKEQEENGVGPTTCDNYAAARCAPELCIECPYNGQVKTPIEAARRRERERKRIEQMRHKAGDDALYMQLWEKFNQYLMQQHNIEMIIDERRVLLASFPDGNKGRAFVFDMGAEPILPAGQVLDDDGRVVAYMFVRTDRRLQTRQTMAVVPLASRNDRDLYDELARMTRMVRPSTPDARWLLARYLEAVSAFCQHYPEMVVTARATGKHGWKQDGFVIGNRIVRLEGGTAPVIWPNGNGFDIRSVGQRQYALEAFWRFLNAATPEMKVGLLTALSAPLAGLVYDIVQANPVLVLYGPSGTGKTQVLEAAAALWSSSNIVLSGNSTTNFFYATANEFCNLPLLIDEFTSFASDGKGLQTFLLDLANGRSRGRATQVGGYRDIQRWQTTVVMATNTPMPRLLKERGNSDASFAALVRAIHLETRPSDTINKTELSDALEELRANGGQVGEWFVEKILANRTKIRRRLRERLKAALTKESSDRRFLVTLRVLLEETLAILGVENMTDIISIIRNKLHAGADIDDAQLTEEEALQQLTKIDPNADVDLTDRQKRRLALLHQQLRMYARQRQAIGDKTATVVVMRSETDTITPSNILDYDNWKHLNTIHGDKGAQPVRMLMAGDETWAWIDFQVVTKAVQDAGEALTVNDYVAWAKQQGFIMSDVAGNVTFELDPRGGEVSPSGVKHVPSLKAPGIVIRII